MSVFIDSLEGCSGAPLHHLGELWGTFAVAGFNLQCVSVSFEGGRFKLKLKMLKLQGPLICSGPLLRS